MFPWRTDCFCSQGFRAGNSSGARVRTLRICTACRHNYCEILGLPRQLIATCVRRLERNTELHWRNYLASCKTLALARFYPKIDVATKRGLGNAFDCFLDSSLRSLGPRVFDTAKAAGEPGDADVRARLPDPWASLRQRRPEEMPRPATKVSYFVWR